MLRLSSRSRNRNVKNKHSKKIEKIHKKNQNMKKITMR